MSARKGPVAVAAMLCLGVVSGVITVPRPDGSAMRPAAPANAQPATGGEIASACGTTSPYFAVSIMARVTDAGDPADVPAVIAFRNTVPGYPRTHVTLATHADVGDVYGLAFDHTRQHVYAAAYYRNGGGFGPGGPGQVYRIDLTTGAVELWASLDVGPEPSEASGDLRPRDAGGGPSQDEALADLVGKIGLGDIDIAPDGSELYVANLYDRRFYRLSLPDGEVVGSFAHGAARASYRAHARPFGLGWHDGWLYHGVVNARETDDAPMPLKAEVYRTRPDGSDREYVLTVGLPYGRRVAWAPWRPISDGRSNDSAILADIAFRPSGALILGLRDRQADMHPDCVWDSTCAAGPSVGDLLPTVPYVGGGWTVVRTPPWYRDTGPDEYDLTWGSLARLPGMDIVVAPARSADGVAAATANRLHTYWFDNGSGARLRGESIIVAPDPTAGSVPSFDRLAAGDIEALCAPDAGIDPKLGATATIEAGVIATATAEEAGRRRATDRAVRETAHIPTAIARETAVVGTATSMAPTLAAAAPRRTAAATERAATASAVEPVLTANAPTAVAIATEAAREVHGAAGHRHLPRRSPTIRSSSRAVGTIRS